MNILVIDPYPPAARLIREVLESHGHRCAVAHSAEDADRILETYPIDGCTVDLGRYDFRGIDWLERLVLQRPELLRRTLVVTGTPLNRRQRRRIVELGAGLLAKPFPLRALVARFEDRATEGRSGRRGPGRTKLPSRDRRDA